MQTILPTANLALFITASLVLLITPGPAVLYIMTRSIDQGRKAGFVSVLAIETGALIHVAAASLGLSAILVSSALAFDVIRYLGAAYLLYLGIRKLRERDVAAVDVEAPAVNLRRVYTQGVVVSVLNPKLALFFFAFLPQFVEPSAGHVGLQVFVLGLIFAALATTTDSLYALVSGSAAGWLRGNRHYQRVQRTVSGTVYIGLGLTAAFSGGRSK